MVWCDDGGQFLVFWTFSIGLLLMFLFAHTALVLLMMMRSHLLFSKSWFYSLVEGLKVMKAINSVYVFVCVTLFHMENDNIWIIHSYSGGSFSQHLCRGVLWPCFPLGEDINIKLQKTTHYQVNLIVFRWFIQHHYHLLYNIHTSEAFLFCLPLILLQCQHTSSAR